MKPQVQVLSRDWLPMTHPPSFASKDLIGCMSLVVMSRSSKKRPAGRDHAGRVDQPTPRWAPDPRRHSPCCFFRRCRVSVPLSCSTCRMICIQTLVCHAIISKHLWFAPCRRHKRPGSSLHPPSGKARGGNTTSASMACSRTRSHVRPARQQQGTQSSAECPRYPALREDAFALTT